MTSGYYLISRIDKLPYYKYKGDVLRLVNQSARTVDEVIIGHKNNPNTIKKITTFRDSDGNIIERAFDLFESVYKNRTYKKYDHVIRENEFVTSTVVKEYILPKTLKNSHLQLVQSGCDRTYLWSPIKFFTNHFSENIENGIKILTQIFRTNILTPQKEVHTFIEFPHIKNGKIQKNPKKILKFVVNTQDEHKIKKFKFKESNVNIPQNDSFLGIRALDMEDAKIALTKKFLSERKIKNKMITINTQYLPKNSVDDNLICLFDANDGSINFVKNYVYKSKSDVCKTARHESEHGWQYYLHALNTKGGITQWEKNMYQIFGDLPKSLKEEAQKYTDSIRNYTPSDKNFEKYMQNYIEKLAHEQGKKASIKYNMESAEIQKEFPHIPKELL